MLCRFSPAGCPTDSKQKITKETKFLSDEPTIFVSFSLLLFMISVPSALNLLSRRSRAAQSAVKIQKAHASIGLKVRRPHSWKPVFRLCPAHIGAGAGVDLDRFAFLYKKGNVDCFSGLK